MSYRWRFNPAVGPLTEPLSEVKKVNAIVRYFICMLHREICEAADLYQRALAIQEKALGPSHPDVAKPLNNLANVYESQGKYAEAADLYQRHAGH